jgi:hypothetical protein
MWEDKWKTRQGLQITHTFFFFAVVFGNSVLSHWECSIH